MNRYFFGFTILLIGFFAVLAFISNQTRENLTPVKVGLRAYIGEIATFRAQEEGSFEGKDWMLIENKCNRSRSNEAQPLYESIIKF